MNEDYLDSLLQSILDMEEKNEDVVPDTTAPDPFKAQSTSELMNQMAGEDSENQQNQNAEWSDMGFEVPGSQTEAEQLDTGYEVSGSHTVAEAEQSDTGYEASGSQTETGQSYTSDEIQGNNLEADSGLTDIGMGGSNRYQQSQSSDAEIDMSDIDALLRSISDPSLSDNETEDTQMSENEIEELLRQTKESAEQTKSPHDGFSDGQDWQEIQDLLTKSDQNEAVDDNILSLLNGDAPRGDRYQAEDLFQDGQAGANKAAKGLSASEKKAAAQKAKEEKAAKKKELLEAKRKEKEAKKASKQEKKASGKKSTGKNAEETEDTSTQDQNRETNPFQIDQLYDNADSFDAEQALSGLNDEPEKSNKRSGLLGKILDFLLEEEAVEEEPRQEKPAKVKKEKKEGKGGKTKKNASKEKPFGGKGDPSGDDDEAAQAKGKAKKKKKVKAAKVPKAAASIEPTVKLPLKKVLAIGSLCATIVAAILVCSTVLTDYSTREEAMDAYRKGNYIQCYIGLYGKKLNDQESFIFHRAECILQAQLPIKRYQVLASHGERTRALDVLIQYVVDYPLLQVKAEAWQARVESQAAYEEVLGLLNTAYGLSAEQALAIGAEPDDLVYTRMVTNIAQGGNYQLPGSDAPSGEENLPMRDVLPEEEGLPDVTFIAGR